MEQSEQESQAYQALYRTFETADPRSFGVYQMIKDIYPALAGKLFERSDLMRKLVMTNYNPMDILDYPVCGKCDSLALWDGIAKKNGKLVRRCTCVGEGCGHSTIDPPTFRTWLLYEIKRKAPPDVAEMAEYIVDMTAMRLMGQATRDYMDIVNNINDDRNKRMGLILPDGMTRTNHNAPPEKVTLRKLTQEDVDKMGLNVDFTEGD